MGIPSGGSELLGKTIVGVVKKNNPNPFSTPASQVFLIFSDRTYYEFYSFSEIEGTTSLKDGGIEEVRGYMESAMKVVFEVVLDKPISRKR